LFFHYQNSLHNKELLQRVSLTSINDILTQAENSKNYRPTLYDFLVHNALDFYETSESYLNKAASDFEMSDARYFNDFENLATVTEDSLSPEFQSLTLYKLLLHFHKTDKDQSAYINNELERLQYIKEKGHFENAVEVASDTFREQLPMSADLLKDKKDKNIIMYCTGGIRCEKASAWFKHLGFKHVFQLDGGIIEYARQVTASGIDNKFIGKNFVFDERLGERISNTIISVCHQCGRPCDTHVNCRNEACHLLFLQCEHCARQFNGCCSESCKEIIALPVEQQRELRKGKKQGRMVFKKGRSENIKFKV